MRPLGDHVRQCALDHLAAQCGILAQPATYEQRLDDLIVVQLEAEDPAAVALTFAKARLPAAGGIAGGHLGKGVSRFSHQRASYEVEVTALATMI